MNNIDKIRILRDMLAEALDSHYANFVDLSNPKHAVYIEEYNAIEKLLKESEAWIEEKTPSDLTTAEDVV